MTIFFSLHQCFFLFLYQQILHSACGSVQDNKPRLAVIWPCPFRMTFSIMNDKACLTCHSEQTFVILSVSEESGKHISCTLSCPRSFTPPAASFRMTDRSDSVQDDRKKWFHWMTWLVTVSDAAFCRFVRCGLLQPHHGP